MQVFLQFELHMQQLYVAWLTPMHKLYSGQWSVPAVKKFSFVSALTHTSVGRHRIQQNA
jgi:hypothetical protein